MNRSDRRFELQSQLHEQYAENYNAHVTTFVTLLIAFFALFGTLGYVFAQSENVWSVEVLDNGKYSLTHYCMLSLFVSAILCFFSNICAMFGYVERRDQVVNRMIREESRLSLVYENPRNRTFLNFMPEFYKAFFVLFVLGQIILFVAICYRTANFKHPLVIVVYVLSIAFLVVSLLSLLSYHLKLKSICYMPTKKDILEKEKAKAPGTILLFEEGLFLKAYEGSAFLLNQKWGLKPTIKHIKVVGQDMVSVGFPTFSLKDYFPGAQIKEKIVTETMDGQVSDADLDKWKKELLSQNEGVCTPAAVPSSLHQEILSFPLESSTPVQCMIFLSELKQKIHAGEI